jgi:anthranilate phosphoribosyltransferase
MATSGGIDAGAVTGDDAFTALGGWPGALGRIVSGSPLREDEAAAVIGQVLDGVATPAQTAALLVALRMKGETVEEMTGLVRAMFAHAVPLSVGGEVVDVVGTGGDRLASINVSTLAACIAAGAGAPVCKHGNRAASSSVGTADVLEALGVAVDLGPTGVERCVREAGMGFCFAPRYHPAMRYAGPVRRELGVPTVLNFLGPLANPARARRQLVGVSDASMAPKMAEVLGANGSVHAMVVYAEDGLDELSVTSSSSVIEIRASPSSPRGFAVRSFRLEPEELGIGRSSMADLRGGDAAFNADVIRRVLDGERSARRDIGVLNAAAALVVAGVAPRLAEGVTMASAALDSGRARAVLDELVRVSREEAEAELAAGAQVPAGGSGLPSAAT